MQPRAGSIIANAMTDHRTTRPRWEYHPGDGPVMATAVHAGHDVRDELLPRFNLSSEERLREEDPMTDFFVGVGDTTFRGWTSRFEVDLNRPEDEAVYLEPSDAWGLEVWKERPTDAMVAASLAERARFYEIMGRRIEAMIAEHGRVLLLDIHSYNHRRDAPDVEADADGNPDIDLGLTTADKGRFGDLVDAFQTELARHPMEAHGKQPRLPDVRENVRFVDGGHWPEWVFATYGENVCTITLEYKKIFMDEWTGMANLGSLEALRRGLFHAVAAAREAL